MSKTHIIIPCYNEAARLPLGEIQELVDQTNAYLILVNDGSVDDTQATLQGLADTLGDRAEILDLPANVGKGEAVRLGFLRAIDRDADILGFVDADMATPANEVLRLIKQLVEHDLDAVFGSRVALLGHQISRSAVRHYLGRIFATAASLTLSLDIYDTQCGAKFFKNSPNLVATVSSPFSSRWAFDVELIGRLGILAGPDKFREIPLRRWADKGGSKMSLTAMLTTFLSLISIRRHLQRFKNR
jgi:dolichyl-phosphate beta-glucosyltransferase